MEDLALASHSVKAGSRLAINASPEPFTNGVVSLGEDGAVLGVVTVEGEGGRRAGVQVAAWLGPLSP